MAASFSPSETMPPFSALVLAGGQSSRMGQDKALIDVGQQPLLVRVCQIAQRCTASVYVITPWIDRYQPILQAHPATRGKIQFIQEQSLPQESLPHGPLVGFAQGLAHLQTDWVLLLACDLPRLEAEVLQHWATQLPSVEAETIALLPRHPQGWWEALCGFYRRACLMSLEAFIRQGGRSFQPWLEAQQVQELPLDNRQMLFNCNTPEDWQAIVQSSSS